MLLISSSFSGLILKMVDKDSLFQGRSIGKLRLLVNHDHFHDGQIPIYPTKWEWWVYGMIFLGSIMFFRRK